MAERAQVPSSQSYEHAAWMLRCEVAAIMAVAYVESGPGGAFLPTGEPVILPEPHIFHELTGGKFDARYPDLSYPKWKPGHYGKASEQHAKLQRMVALDKEAAFKATSWGLFQIMGHNYRRAGFATVQAMVNAAYKDVDEHLRMFVRFIMADDAMADALRDHRWADFARRYNGTRFSENHYDTKMAQAYERFSA
jgi:hypothetical protein